MPNHFTYKVIQNEQKNTLGEKASLTLYFPRREENSVTGSLFQQLIIY